MSTEHSTLHMLYDSSDETLRLGMENMSYIARDERKTWVVAEVRKAAMTVNLIARSSVSDEEKSHMTQLEIIDVLSEQLFCGAHDSETWNFFTEHESRRAAAESKLLLDEEEMEDISGCTLSVFYSMVENLQTNLGDPSEMDNVSQKAFFEMALTGSANEIYTMGLRYGPAVRDLKALESIGVQDA